MPWARPGARHSRDVEDMIAWLVQPSEKTTTASLTPVSLAELGRRQWQPSCVHVTELVVERLGEVGLSRPRHDQARVAMMGPTGSVGPWRNQPSARSSSAWPLRRRAKAVR